MSRENLLRAGVALLLALVAAWLVARTEWREVEEATPARGEALKNPLYAAQSLARQLGARVTRRTQLDAMPPPQATLVLTSRHWALFPGREDRLRQWVQAGGHLVLSLSLAEDDPFEDWLPVASRDVDHKPRGGASRSTVPRRAGEGKDADCHAVTEPEHVPASYAGARTLRLCSPGWRRVQTENPQANLWSLDDGQGSEMVRVRLGQGTVTVIAPWVMLDNHNLLRGDNPLAATAALQLRPGADLWFVAEESRQPLLPWLWQQAWPAVVLGLLALGAALWRAAPRFGPAAGPRENQRRSMSEQVRGTAQYLRRNGGAALHAAQVRALNEWAARRLRDGARLDPAGRARAIAAATALPEAALARAMQPGVRAPAELAADLELMETARRRLAANP